MNRRRAIVAALALVALILLVWRATRTPAVHSGRTAPNSAVGTAAIPSAVGNPPSAISPPVPGADSSRLARQLNSPTGDIRADLRIVSSFLATYRSNFPRDGNPVGSNPEITAALTGHNRLNLVLLPPDHPAINRDGALCDRWGTPFFFHAESGTRMGIRSAGPDRKMWTDDDVVFEP